MNLCVMIMYLLFRVIARRRDDGQDEMLSMSVCTECKEGVEEMEWREGYQCIES